jgi:hypothetical protein
MSGSSNSSSTRRNCVLHLLHHQQMHNSFIRKAVARQHSSQVREAVGSTEQDAAVTVGCQTAATPAEMVSNRRTGNCLRCSNGCR